MPKLELLAAALFFTLTAVATVLLRQPLDLTGWCVLLASVAFVALAVIGMIKPTAFSKGMPPRITRDPSIGVKVGEDTDQPPADEPSADTAGLAMGEDHDRIRGRVPTTSEVRLLTATIEALVAVDGLNRGEVDALSLWNVLEELDPGRAIGVDEAISSFAALHDLGRSRIGRMTFVPAHTEYDEQLLAEITASLLTSLGHAFRPQDIVVKLPPDGNEGRASIEFSLDGRTEAVECSYLWKYPPADLVDGLKRFSKRDDPRQLAGSHAGDQTLLFVAIREGAIGELNALLPTDTDLFYEA